MKWNGDKRVVESVLLPGSRKPALRLSLLLRVNTVSTCLLLGCASVG